MTHGYNFSFPLLNGLHARPASHLADFASRFRSSVVFTNTRTGRVANAKSVLELVSTDTRRNDACQLAFSGSDAETAKTEFAAFVSGAFRQCDEPLIPIPVVAGDVVVPRSLRAAGLEAYLTGVVACAGLAEGQLVMMRGCGLPSGTLPVKSGSPAHEFGQFTGSLAELKAEYARGVAVARGTAAEILQAHLGLLNDPALADQVERRTRDGHGAAQAVREAITGYMEVLGNSESAYLRERVLDLEDIGGQLIARITGQDLDGALPKLTQPTIIAAERLTPRQLLGLDRANLRGLVLGQAGVTSHTAILARSFNIPTLAGVTLVGLGAAAGRLAIVDAQTGLFVPNAGDGVKQFYRTEQVKLAQLAARYAGRKNQPGMTADSRRLEVGANIVTGQEAPAAFESGAEGIGLFRTELLFADRNEAPGEEEQYQAYTTVVQAAAGRPVIIRTFDIGGDKPAPYLPMPAENNPYLGYRGVRLYREHRELIVTQLRALWRASVHGPVKVLVPMVSCVEEARFVRALMNEAQAELRTENIPCGSELGFGLMLEVPSVAFALGELCEVSDFFSIGTNDLAQYFLAADRENEKVATLYSPLHPPFLRLLRQLVDGVRARGRWVGLCGAMAEDPTVLPLLVGLGLDEISVPPAQIPAVKAALAELHDSKCRDLLQKTLTCGTRSEVEYQLASFRRQAVPMLEAALVLPALSGGTREEVIRALVNALHVAGRTARPEVVEEAIWRREETYSTGFGDGFALPHCKTDAVTDNSIVVARLARPVAWQSIDGQDVDVVILMAIRAGDHEREHMRTLAQLSRLMMQESFRLQLRAVEASADAVVKLILQQLAAANENANNPTTVTL